MTTVGTKELKNRLSTYLTLVRAGETVEVTDRGKVIAHILPATTPREAETARLLANLARKGGIRFGSGELTPRRRTPAMTPGKSIAEMISEDRR
jgi:prevent-host-death family protein